jgi:hypothetical protein
MEFFEAPAFTLYLPEYLTDDEYRRLQIQLTHNPELGRVIPGTGGLRKLRWADQRRGKGRRGGLRIIYYYFLADQQIWFMTLYNKDEASDLSPKEKKALKKILDKELHVRETTRPARFGKLWRDR